MLEHGSDDRQGIGIDDFTSSKRLQQTEEVEIFVEVKVGDVEPEKNTEADRPYFRDVPPSLEPMSHDAEPPGPA